MWHSINYKNTHIIVNRWTQFLYHHIYLLGKKQSLSESLYGSLHNMHVCAPIPFKPVEPLFLTSVYSWYMTFQKYYCAMIFRRYCIPARLRSQVDHLSKYINHIRLYKPVYFSCSLMSHPIHPLTYYDNILYN